MNTQKAKKEKKFKAPHLFVIVMFLLVAASVLTYIVPAGAFDTDPQTGQIIGDSFHFAENTPVNIFQALNHMNILFAGGMMGVFLATNAIDDLIKYSIYKLQDKGMTVLLPAVCCLCLCWALSAATTPLRLSPLLV